MKRSFTEVDPISQQHKLQWPSLQKGWYQEPFGFYPKIQEYTSNIVDIF